MGDFDFDDPRPSARRQSPPPQFPPSNSLGITSLVIGCVGIPIALIPLAGVVVLPIAVIGLLLGFAGLAVSIARHGYGIGFPIGGLICCLVAAALAVIQGGAIAYYQRMHDELTRPRMEEQIKPLDR